MELYIGELDTLFPHPDSTRLKIRDGEANDNEHSFL
jgi:hypothetical protein